MYNSTKVYVKRKVLKLMNECDITLDDIRLAIDELEDDIEGKDVARIAREASINTIQKSLNFGVPVTFNIDGYLCKMCSDGTVVKLRKLKDQILVNKRVYNL